MHNKRGFTLIEMLVVIAIIAILMTIAIAVAGVLMARAENTAAASQIQKILAACEKFKGDFGAYPQELSAVKVRVPGRQKPNADESSANNLAKYLFKKNPGSGASNGASTKGDPTSWNGDYLDDNDISKGFISDDTNNNILDYWMEKPLVYWLRYKSSGNSDPATASEIKYKLTPEIWSLGADGDKGSNNCLQISAYPDLKKCVSSHSNDEDNVGGDMNTMKK